MTVPNSPHVAVRDEDCAFWLVSYLPGRLLETGQALEALIAAELVAGGVVDRTDARWVVLHDLADDLGSRSVDEIVALISAPPLPIVAIAEGALL